MTTMQDIRAAVAQDTALKAAGRGLQDGSVVTTTEPIFHGGDGSFDVGSILLPPVLTNYLRPQSMAVQSGKPVHWLENKASYDPNFVYATRFLPLARDHAAGFSNWSMLTRATDVLPRFGAVYQVVPLRTPLEIDYAIGGCCCSRSGGKIHPLNEPCMFRAKRFVVTRVVERDVRAVWDSDWRLRLRNLEDSYHEWREQKGSDWYERNSVR